MSQSSTLLTKSWLEVTVKSRVGETRSLLLTADVGETISLLPHLCLFTVVVVIVSPLSVPGLANCTLSGAGSLCKNDRKRTCKTPNWSFSSIMHKSNFDYTQPSQIQQEQTLCFQKNGCKSQDWRNLWQLWNIHYVNWSFFVSGRCGLSQCWQYA